MADLHYAVYQPNLRSRMKGSYGELKGQHPAAITFSPESAPTWTFFYQPPAVNIIDVAFLFACSRLTNHGGTSCIRSKCCVGNNRQCPWRAVYMMWSLFLLRCKA